jgi:hypothetical protein
LNSSISINNTLFLFQVQRLEFMAIKTNKKLPKQAKQQKPSPHNYAKIGKILRDKLMGGFV